MSRVLRWAWGVWPLLAVVVGLGLVGVCLLFPQWEENRRLEVERARLEGEYAKVKARIDANAAFLRQARDSGPVGRALRERLAERQLRLLPAGTEAMPLPGLPEDPRSPFHLIAASIGTWDEGEGAAVYVPVWGGRLSFLDHERARLLILAGALMLVGTGLVCDRPRRYRQAETAATA